MRTITETGRSPRTGLGSRLISLVRTKWRENRQLRAAESVPFAVMKDVGYPAVGNMHDA